MRRAVWIVATALVALAGAGVGLALALRPSPPRPFVDAAPAGKLRVSIPSGFYRHTFHDGIGYTPFPPSGQTLTDGPIADPRLSDWYRNGPPANHVGLLVAEWFGIGPPPGDDRLSLPLSPGQQWIRLPNGMKFGSVRFGGMDYEVSYWIGPEAPASDRAAVLDTLRSIRPSQ